MLTEHHCHILPKIDDGSKSVEMSLKMISMIKSQGVGNIIATPHFYAHREKSVASFLEKRNHALEKLIEADPENKNIILGAEIAVEHGISKLPDIDKLRIGDTKYILRELPYSNFASWCLEEITDTAYEYGFTPIIAHIHRYLDYYKKSELEEVLKLDAIFQINNEAFGSFREKRFVKSLINDGYPYLFGSDAHNLSDRKPNWDLLQKKAKDSIIEGAEIIL